MFIAVLMFLRFAADLMYRINYSQDNKKENNTDIDEE